MGMGVTVPRGICDVLQQGTNINNFVEYFSDSVAKPILPLLQEVLVGFGPAVGRCAWRSHRICLSILRASGNTAHSSPCWYLLATRIRVVNYHSSWFGQQQVELWMHLVFQVWCKYERLESAGVLAFSSIEICPSISIRPVDVSSCVSSLSDVVWWVTAV
ncbi:NBS-LRR type disease resistance protein [Dorcoceras hygrometricum]|uniref:NBS-LRR type disease resistance protein n=1 Tax=Dorcoceras hygrometricum TaxID=472368 RepID=A0A2Z7BVZ2_9LAMI|nr:NBS-LRR type disease resistance protein [Dorcoceras hygrometricum]